MRKPIQLLNSVESGKTRETYSVLLVYNEILERSFRPVWNEHCTKKEIKIGLALKTLIKT